MFAPKVLRPQTKAAASSTSKLAHQRFAFAAHPPSHSLVEQALFLQSTIGNQATLRYLTDRLSNSTAKAIEQDEPEAGHAAREGSRVSWDFSNIPVFPPQRTGQSHMQSTIAASSRVAAIQPKLEVGPVDDPLEHEADRVAGQVMRMPDTELYRTSAPAQLSRKGEAYEEEDRGLLQTEPTGGPDTIGHGAPHSSVHEVLR